jgi:hypothetical protein
MSTVAARVPGADDQVGCSLQGKRFYLLEGAKKTKNKKFTTGKRIGFQQGSVTRGAQRARGVEIETDGSNLEARSGEPGADRIDEAGVGGAAIEWPWRGVAAEACALGWRLQGGGGGMGEELLVLEEGSGPLPAHRRGHPARRCGAALPRSFPSFHRRRR